MQSCMVFSKLLPISFSNKRLKSANTLRSAAVRSVLIMTKATAAKWRGKVAISLGKAKRSIGIVPSLNISHLVKSYSSLSKTAAMISSPFFKVLRPRFLLHTSFELQIKLVIFFNHGRCKIATEFLVVVFVGLCQAGGTSMRNEYSWN
jgi:hypothetical protein